MVLSSITDVVKTKESTSHFGGFIQPISGGVGDGLFLGMGLDETNVGISGMEIILGGYSQTRDRNSTHGIAWHDHTIRKTVWEAQKVHTDHVRTVPYLSHGLPNTFVGARRMNMVSIPP